MSQDRDRDVTALSDEELVAEMWNKFGYRGGPITTTTRSVYEKKLLNLRKGQSASKLTPSKRPQNGDNADKTGLYAHTPHIIFNH